MSTASGTRLVPRFSRRSRTRVVLLTIAALVAVGVFALAVGAFFSWMSQPAPTPFSSEAWKHPGKDQWDMGPRRAMLDDLFRRHPLVGMKRADVEALLGKPDGDPWSDLYPGAGYAIGLPSPAMFGDSDDVPLLITYDKDSVVREVEVF